MFDSLFDPVFTSNGRVVEHEGKTYLQVHHTSWVTDAGFVECKFVIDIPNSVDVPVLSDVKVLINFKARST